MLAYEDKLYYMSLPHLWGNRNWNCYEVVCILCYFWEWFWSTFRSSLLTSQNASYPKKQIEEENIVLWLRKLRRGSDIETLNALVTCFWGKLRDRFE